MYRFFVKYLDQWAQKTNRKPLIIRGARQVGKTYTIRDFASKKFQSFMEVNFEENQEICEIFDTQDVQTILPSLELIYGKRIQPGETLLFLDEIQACPKAILKLRYFYERIKDLHIIAAGSLLDFTLRDFKYSMPVGRVEFAYMYPMNFYEFLLALGQNQLVDFLRDFNMKKQIPEPIHNRLLEFVRLYYLVGGMPEAVKVYSQTNSLADVEVVHESILTSLQYDFAKYGSRTNQEVLIKVLRYIPKALGRKFKFSDVDKTLRVETVKRALNQLEKSRIVHRIKNSLAETPPLEYGVKSNFFKPLFLDLGLANHLLNLRLISNDDLILSNRGSLAEQFVAQQLLTLEPYYIDKQLYYWQREKRNAEAEVDLLHEFQGQIIPIEIKSGKSGRLKSLQVYCYEKKRDFAVRFYTGIADLQKISTSIRIGGSMQKVSFSLLNLPLYLTLEINRLLKRYKDEKIKRVKATKSKR